VGANIRGRWGKGGAGGGGGHANHRCVQVDEEGGPGNNFLGHEILFYEGEILLGQPVRKHLFKSVCTCTYSQGVPRGGDVTFGAQKSRIRELRRRCEMNLRQF